MYLHILIYSEAYRKTFKLLIFNISSGPLIEQIGLSSEKSGMRWPLLTESFLKFPRKNKKVERKESLTYLSLCKGQKGIQQQFAWLQGQHVSWGAPAYFSQLSQLQDDLSHPSKVVKPNGRNAKPSSVMGTRVSEDGTMQLVSLIISASSVPKSGKSF